MKKKLYFAAALYTLAQLAATLTPRACSRPDLSTLERVASASVALPVFVIPALDLLRGNALRCVFVDDSDPGRIAVTAVFDDEDYPWLLGDVLYDLVRLPFWNRVADLETLYYVKGGEQQPDGIEFRRTYAQSQSFGVLFASHHSARVPLERFGHQGDRPMLYVNSWNHMFGESSNNPGVELVPVADYPVYRGSRADAERLYTGRGGGARGGV